jgi:hypothetical protein
VYAPFIPVLISMGIKLEHVYLYFIKILSAIMFDLTSDLKCLPASRVLVCERELVV